MSWPLWLWLALALALLPGVPAARTRARALGARGRLAVDPARAIDPARATETARVAETAAPPRSAGQGLPLGTLAAAATGALAAGGAALGGPAIGLAALIVGGTAARLALAAHRRRRRDRADRELLAALRLAAAELEAGTAPAAALRAAAHAAPQHRAQFGALAARIDTAVESAPEAVADAPGDGLVGLAAAWQLAAATGAPLADVCARVARDLAARIDQRGAVATALAGARSSAALLAVLPALGLALGSAMQAGPVTVLLTTPTGHALLVGGVALDAAGLLWTHRLARSAERP